MIWVALLGLMAGLGWALHQRRDPLLYLVPVSLTFPPMMWYAGQALGWPLGRLSTRVALVGCLAVWIGHRVVRGEFAWGSFKQQWFVWPYLALVLASVVWAVLGVGAGEVAVVADELVTWALPVSIFIALAPAPRHEGDWPVAARALLLCVLGAGAVALSQVLYYADLQNLVPSPLVQLAQHVRDETWFGAFRVYGTFPTIGPNMFGAFLLIPAAILLSRTVGASGFSRWGWGLGALTAVATVVVTLSRGAQIGLVTLLILLPLWRRSWRTGVAVAVLAGLGAVLAAGTAVSRQAARLVSGLDIGALERLGIWRTILSDAPAHPLGHGFNGWLRVSGRLFEGGAFAGANTVGSSYPAENQWLRELADRGPLGVAALGLLIGGLLVTTYRSAGASGSTWQRDFMAGAGAGIGGLAVAMLTGDHLTYDSVAGMFWFIAALVVSVPTLTAGLAPTAAVTDFERRGTGVSDR